MCETGLNTLRYGPPCDRVHTAPHAYDWSHADPQMQALQQLGVTVIADLCHSRGRFGAWRYEVGNMGHSVAQGVEWADRIGQGARDDEQTYVAKRGSCR